jgi:hypothetical protein
VRPKTPPSRPTLPNEDETMHRKVWIGTVLAALVGVALIAAPRVSEVQAQKPRAEPEWEYKVGVFAYNPGERMTDEQRAAVYQRVLNEQALQGWEAVGSVMSRDTVQTVGGAVTTRDTTSFVAYRRPKR